ncbi:MAG: Dam family site-specific DNA-(adenine-N6)-methyltransferase [Deltaproteobacteria bacterium]|nr:Dam family site-specific DNA-(adenine-N6)-methyltransferase [Deltaproteobacteria bacterium]
MPPWQEKRNRGRRPISFVKWAGSKSAVLDRLLPFFPAKFGTYYEPMVGSGSIFFTLRPSGVAVLGDLNEELIHTYAVLRDHVEELIAALQQHVNTYEHYLEVRALRPGDLPPVERAARLIYLNKTGYNGLYRVNAKGYFNVPYGRISHANICDSRTLRELAPLLRNVRLCAGDYRMTVQQARTGDLVYLDPPYYPLPTTRELFGRYQPQIFGKAEHHELAVIFRELDRRGCHVLLSNSDTDAVRALFAGYHIETLTVRRCIHWSPDKRAGYTELLITNGPAASSPGRRCASGQQMRL